MKSELISRLSVNIQNLLTEELECYRRLIELSERQQCFIHSGDTDALMSIIAQKEDLISKISRLESVIQRIFRRFPTVDGSRRGITENPKRLYGMPESVHPVRYSVSEILLSHGVKRLIDKITAILKQLTTLEKESESRLMAKYNDLKKELGNLKQSKTIIKTYAPQRRYRPRFIDKKT